MFFLIVATTFSSCETAQYPIDEKPTSKIDEAYLGTWKSKRYSPDNFVVTKMDEYHYSINIKPQRHTYDTRYEAFISKVNNTNFMNIHCIDSGVLLGYAFYRILNLSEDRRKISLATIDDTTMKNLVSSNQVKAYIRTHMNLPQFYSDTFVLVKVK